MSRKLRWLSVCAAALFALFAAVGSAGAVEATGCPGGETSAFTLSGEVEHPGTYTAAKLDQLPQTSVQEVYTDKKGLEGPIEFQGVLLWDLLKAAVVKTNPDIKNDIGLKYVLITGSDCYQQLFSMGEINPAVGGSTQITVAYGKSVKAGDGFARLIPPGDKGGDRSVYNIMSIDVMNGEKKPK
jgi:hypothetical protein